VATKKGNRQQARARQLAQARRAAAEARRRKERQRKLSIAGVVAIVAAVGVVAILAISSGGDKTDVSTTGTSATAPAQSTPEALESVAGQPCKALADPLPAGAPNVPVKVGPPPTALVKEDLKPGTGAVVAPGQTLKVNYIGVSCSTGKIFDSSYSTGEPAEFSLTGVIPGWQEGIPGMQVGGQRLLGIPPDQAYGDDGGGADIAPGETLWFVVEVLDAT
jgi:peptidylprolyl isomerase